MIFAKPSPHPATSPGSNFVGKHFWPRTVTYWHVFKMCHVTFSWPDHDLTFISGGRGDGGGVYLLESWQTTVSTFVRVTPLGWDNSHPCSWQQKSDIYDGKPVHLQLWQPKQVFYAKTWSFPNPNQMFFVPKPNQTISTAMLHKKFENLNRKQKVFDVCVVCTSTHCQHSLWWWGRHNVSTAKQKKQNHKIWT